MITRALSLALLLLCVASCTKAGGVGWGRAHELRIGMVGDPDSLNPLFSYVERQIDLTQLYCETLVGLDDRNRLAPLLATVVPSQSNGGISPDRKTIVYHLRHGVRFADGVELTSKDVAFTYRAVLDPRNPVVDTEAYRAIASLDTPDRYTVRIRLRHPWAAAVGELFAPSDFAYGILPAHAFAGTDVSRADWNAHPFGSGPFRVVRWARGDEIELAPNPYAWRKPRLRKVVFKIVAQNEAMFDAFRARELDVDNVTILQVPQARALRDAALVGVLRNGFDYLSFQHRQAARPTTAEPARDRRVDRSSRPDSREPIFGLRPIANTEIPSVLWANDRSIQPVPYDPRQAARDLDAAGLASRRDPPHEESGSRSPSTSSPTYATTIAASKHWSQRDLAEVGINVRSHSDVNTDHVRAGVSRRHSIRRPIQSLLRQSYGGNGSGGIRKLDVREAASRRCQHGAFLRSCL